jgi:hypothetical protein
MITPDPRTRSPHSGIQPVQEKIETIVAVCAGERRPVAELLAAFHSFHPNILLIGSAIETESALAQIHPSLLTPLDSWSPTDLSYLPHSGFRSLIVRDVECLTAKQQTSLAALLSRSDVDVQIVSIARLPLFPLVCQGLFLEDLYYRLNVVLLESSRDGSFGW